MSLNCASVLMDTLNQFSTAVSILHAILIESSLECQKIYCVDKLADIRDQMAAEEYRNLGQVTKANTMRDVTNNSYM